MPKIIRYNGNLKAFASEQLTNERTLFGQVTIANDLTSQYTPQFLRGWGIVGPSDQPSLQDFNGAMYTHGQTLAYLHQMGVAEYNAAQEYFIGSMTQTGGVLYISLADANVGNAPASSPASWKAFIIPVQATESVVGIMALANAAEAAAGVNDTKAMTALKVKQAITAQTAVSTDGIAGSFSNLKISATGTSAPVSITADSICVKTAAFAQKVLNAVAVTPSLAASGANGLDAGVSTVSTWYSVWVIWNGSTTAGLLSLSATAPTMPSGYTHKARVGWIRTDSTADKYPLSFLQYGRRVNYRLGGGNMATFPALTSGAVGSYGVSFSSASISAFCPPTASSIRLSYGATAASNIVIVIAPNSTYTPILGNVKSPPLCSTNQGSTQSFAGDMPLESSNIYISAQSATFSSVIGWEDNL